jgi:hypothetical protein
MFDTTWIWIAAGRGRKRARERQCVTFVLGRETQVLAQGVVDKVFRFARLGDNCFKF